MATTSGPRSSGGTGISLVRVRRRDLRRLRRSGPPPGVALPSVFGATKDPRFPSRRGLRSVVAFMIDLALHFGIGAATLWAFHHGRRSARRAWDCAWSAMIRVAA